jgi:hypothetical protein
MAEDLLIPLQARDVRLRLAIVSGSHSQIPTRYAIRKMPIRSAMVEREDNPDIIEGQVFGSARRLRNHRMKNSSAYNQSPEVLRAALDQLHDAIRRRAEEIYVRSGKLPGRDVQNWIQAEQEILREDAERTSRRTAVVVKVEGVRYVGEYSAESAGGYTPGEFAAGEPVPVRFQGENMYIQRPNGLELKTTIVKH